MTEQALGVDLGVCDCGRRISASNPRRGCWCWGCAGEGPEADPEEAMRKRIVYRRQIEARADSEHVRIVKKHEAKKR
jgi:hypothetical protein